MASFMPWLAHLVFLAALATRCGATSDEVLDIILWYEKSSPPGSSVKGLIVEIINGYNASLQAVARKNLNSTATLRFDWQKDNEIIKTEMPNLENLTNADISSRLFFSSISSEKRSGNYSVQLRQSDGVVAVVHVTIVFGDVRKINLSSVPTEFICSSENNSSLVLSFTAVGFPTPVYRLVCQGWQYISEYSRKEQLVIPPEVCCAGAMCKVEAFNSNERVRSKEVIVKQKAIDPICQHILGCLSPRLEIFLSYPCTFRPVAKDSAVYIEEGGSDAVLEAFAYQNVSKFTSVSNPRREEQIRLSWFKKDNITEKQLDITHCNGDPLWGSWIFCRLRLKLSAVSGNRSGNYSISLKNSSLIMSIRIVVTVKERESSLSSSNCTQASSSASFRLPPTCAVLDTVKPGGNTSTTFAIVAAIGATLTAALVAIVVRYRLKIVPKKLILLFQALRKTSHYSVNNMHLVEQTPTAPLNHAISDQGYFEHRLVSAPCETISGDAYKNADNETDEVEIDGVSTLPESHLLGLSEVMPAPVGRQATEQQLSSALMNVVSDAFKNIPQHRQNSVVLATLNLQVGNNNTMNVNNYAHIADDGGGCEQNSNYHSPLPE